MIKKLYESFEKKLKETTSEKVNLTLESLAELNEEDHNEEVITNEIFIGPRKYSIEVYPNIESGNIAHWKDISDDAYGYGNEGWVSFDEEAKFSAIKEKGFADLEDYVLVSSDYNRSLRPEVKHEIIKKVLTVRGEGQPEDLEESVAKELIDEFADQYGLSKEEAKRKLSHLSKEEQEEKLKALKGVRSNNAKIEIETEALTEELDENTKKEVEVELEDILKRNPEKHGFDADTEEVKYYVVKLLKDKGYKTETSGNDNYKPNKYHVEYWKEENIEENIKSKVVTEEYISNDVLWDALQEDEFYSFDIDGEEHYIEIYEKNDDSVTFNYYPDRGTEPETMSKIDFIEWTTADKTAEEIKAEYGI